MLAHSIYLVNIQYSHAAIQCPPIPAIPNGVIITYTPDNIPNYDLGTVATYACNAGFVLDLSIGGSVTRTCVDNDEEGVFNRQGPNCIGIISVTTCCLLKALHYCNSHAAIQCPPVLAIPNGVITYAPDNTPNYDLGTVATYACNAGFVLDLSIGGSEIRTCVDDNGLDAIGEFDRQAPRCVRKSNRPGVGTL